MVLYCVVEKRHYLTGMELQYWHPCPRVGHWWPTSVGHWGSRDKNFYKSRQWRLGIHYTVWGSPSSPGRIIENIFFSHRGGQMASERNCYHFNKHLHRFQSKRIETDFSVSWAGNMGPAGCDHTVNLLNLSL